MADWTRHDVTTMRRIYTLPSPTNWAEVGKVMSAIHADLEAQGRPTDYDDIVKVEAWDDEIRFSFLMDTTGEPA